MTRLTQEIENFDKSTLKKQYVHLVSGSSSSLVPKIHSYIVIGDKAESKQKSYGHVFFCGPSVMHQPYKVTLRMFIKVMANMGLSPSVKAVMGELIGHEYPSVEHFCRDFLIKQKGLANKTISDDEKKEIYLQAAEPNALLQWLISLQSVISADIKGAVLPLNPNSGGRVNDRKRFEKGKTENTVYPKIDPMIVRDLYQQQLLYARYMDEKAGIGKATKWKLKPQVSANTTKRMMDSLVAFDYTPRDFDIFTANCNKASTTLLQEAEDISARAENREPEMVVAPSDAAYGTTQRMFLWNPLVPSLKSIVNNLIDKADIKEATTTMSLAELISKKNAVFHIINCLPEESQIKALTQALNKDGKNSVLSQIFCHLDAVTSLQQLHKPYRLQMADKLKQLQSPKNQTAEDTIQRPRPR